MNSPITPLDACLLRTDVVSSLERMEIVQSGRGPSWEVLLTLATDAR